MRFPEFLKDFFRRSDGTVAPASLPDGGAAPEFAGVGPWLGSSPLSMEALRGKVVLVDFWTSSCIACIRTIPHVNAWHKKYADKGLVIVGAHTPEFDFEKDEATVHAAMGRHVIRYPVVMDNDYVLWDAYKNRYWPAHYFIDHRGRVRHRRFGEGGYARSEAVIRALLKEAGADLRNDSGADAPEERSGSRTREAYLGHRRLEHLGSPESVVMDAPHKYSAVPKPARNVFYLDGEWTLRPEFAESTAGAKLLFRYDAAEVHLVMSGSGRVSINVDGDRITDAHAGADVRDGTVTVNEGRLYRLIRSKNGREERVLELTFEDPGTRAYAFTFD